MRKETFLIFLILALSLALNIYGLNWGLPSLWNVDQSVTTALNMFKNRSFFPEDYLHPSLYYYILAVVICPYLIFQYFFYPNFNAFLSASRVSWNYLAINHPDLASGIFISARASSVVFSLLTVFFVYRIAKVFHSTRAGLISALILTLTMDFVNWAHIEKSVALVNLLMLLSIYFGTLIFKNGYSDKNYFLCCLFGGLALSTKFNGALAVLLIPIISLWKNFQKGHGTCFIKNFKGFLRTLAYGIIAYFLTFLLTSPGILLKGHKYYAESMREYKYKIIPDSSAILSKIWFANIISVIQSFVQMFGLPLFLLVLCGLICVIVKYRRKPHGYPYFILACVPLLTVCLLICSPRVYYDSANSKFIAQAVPFMSILGGIFCADALPGKISFCFKNFLKIAALSAIFISSLFYCFFLDKIFVYDDLRYHATKWVESNIPERSTLVLGGPLEYSLGVEILKNYNVYVLGREIGSKGAYSLINGEYSNIDENRFSELSKLDSYYFIRSCWQTRAYYSCGAMGSFKNGLRLYKILEHKRPWFWSPGLGGYEPIRIEVYKNAY